MSTNEQRQQYINGLLEERAAYEGRVAMAEEDGDKEAASKFKAQIDEVNAELRAYGHKGAAPAKRAERRPRKASESRSGMTTDEGSGGAFVAPKRVRK